MFDLASFSAGAFWTFLQVFARVTALFVSAPVFGDQAIPAQVKVGLSTILSLALLPLVKPTLETTVPESLSRVIGVLLGQVLIGLLIGLVVSLLFAAVRVGSGLIDYQMGFTQASTFNPQFNESVSPITDFQSRYAMVLYLLVNGHWLLLAALVQSFVKLPVSHLSLGSGAIDAFVMLTSQMMASGLQIAAPAAAVLLITDIAFAFLNRALPQMQVFYLGMPVKIIAGLVMVLAILPILTSVITNSVTHEMPDQLFTLLRGMRGP
jgi:flagellar biosynthetic protein FliR